MPTVLEAEVEDHLDKALDYPTVEGRYAALLQLYLLAPDDRADLLAVALFRRLAVTGVNASVPSNLARAEENPGVPTPPAAPGQIAYVASDRRSLLDWVAAVFPRVRS